jgi:hypothetical protein
MIHVMAKGRDGGERSFVLVNFDLTTGSGRVQKDSVERKMLMAEFLRKYVVQIRQTIALSPRPTLVLMGNRDVPREAPAAQILSGRIRMQNIEFEECALAEDKQTISCSKMPIFPQTLFGVFSDSLIQQQETLMLKKWGRVSYYIRKLTPESYQELKNERLEQVTDIYLFDSDLRLAWQHSRTPGRYAAGYEPVKNGLESSPLVWTHLNW